MIRTRVGYAGGTRQNPTYRALGDHTETLQIDFDPQRITYEQLLEIFWTSHNPCRRAWSRQYMSAIFYHDEPQRAAIAATRERFVDEPDAVTTVIAPLEKFWLAEDYHQKYRLRGEEVLLRELEAFYPEPGDLVASTAATRINGYLAGHGDAVQFERELEILGLSAKGRELLRSAR